MPSPVTRYTGGEPRIAYQLTGTGPALAVTPGWVSHLDLDAGTPEVRAFYERLAQGRLLVRYDKRGAGLSDRVVGAEGFTLDCQVRDLERVLAAAGVRRTALLGWSQSGPIAI